MPEKIKPFKQTIEKKIKTQWFKTADRKADQAFYDSARWKKLRKLKLNMNPVCQCVDRCKQPATEVHHIIDRKDRPDLAYEITNLISLTTSCHSKITRNNQTKSNMKQ